MEIQNIQRNKTERKTESISIRTYKSYSKWMRKSNVSPTALFNEAVKELMEKNK